jgi:hyperosmotically inducible periplasmic protein
MQQKYWISTLAAGMLLALTACQNNGGKTSLLSTSPTFPAYSHMSLAQSVQEALGRSEDPVIAQISVQNRQNMVILTGYVKKIRQSDLAEQIAGQIAGPQQVENHIIVRQ